MNDYLISQRIRDLEDSIREDLKLLKEYEDALRLEVDPRRLASHRRNIERQRESLAKNRKEYEELRAQVAPAEMQKSHELLQQKESRLADLQKLLPLIWNVPFDRNPNFTGREQVLAELRAALASGQLDAWKQALWGMGGVGKSQVAVEYAYRHKADYKVIWWIRSEEAATLVADYADLAKELDLPEKGLKEQAEIAKAVRRRLEHSQGWLLIFDNAQYPRDLQAYLPKGGGGHVIITSKNPEWGSHAKKLEIKVFDRLDSIKFLLKRTDQEDGEAADVLADALGDLPLALEQAGAYISKSGMPLSRYLEMYQKHKMKILERGEPTAYPATVATTWEISFQRLQKESLAAAELLNLCAFLAPDEIPRSLPAKGPQFLSEALASAVQDELLLEDAISALRGYSLISMTEGSGDFSVHRLVQAVIQDRLAEDGKKGWAEAAVKLLNSAFPFKKDDLMTWEESGLLLPHALAVAGHAEKLDSAPEEASRLLNEAALYLKLRGQFPEAKASLERALEIGLKVYGPDHPRVAIYTNNLGNVLRDLGDLQGAKKNYERALEIDLMVYGPDHPDVAICLSNLGLVLRDLGDLQGAKKNFERALEIDLMVYGPDHPDVAIGLNNLGSVLRDLGDLQGARKNYERALEIGLMVYGPDHPDVAICLSNLGNVLRDLGDLQGARKNYERALEIDLKVYGPDHPKVATMTNNLGMALQDLGDLDGARKHFERALEIDENAFGPDHPNVARDVNNLGLALQALGDLDGAKKHFERARKINEKVFGPNYPRLATDLNNLGLALQALGDLDGAKKHFERARKINEKVFGPNYPRLATDLNNLGLALQALGDLQGAKKNYEWALQIFQKFLGDDHPKTRTVQANLDSLLAAKKPE
jgi:tetratricopeptide (TPR) repeat protein